MRRVPPFIVLAALAALGLVLLAGCGSTGESTTTVPAVTQTSAPGDIPSAVTDTTAARAATRAADGTTVVIETSVGAITVALDKAKAPTTVANFLAYARSGFYDGTIFHRVIPGFMIQGGGFTTDMQQKPTNPPIKNEAGNGLTNLRGTVAMARTPAVDSASSQFFINLVDNPSLDHQDDSAQGFGYAVFGRVTAGMDVVDKIAGVPTTSQGAFQNVPQTPIVIQSVRVVAP